MNIWISMFVLEVFVCDFYLKLKLIYLFFQRNAFSYWYHGVICKYLRLMLIILGIIQVQINIYLSLLEKTHTYVIVCKSDICTFIFS